MPDIRRWALNRNFQTRMEKKLISGSGRNPIRLYVKIVYSAVVCILLLPLNLWPQSTVRAVLVQNAPDIDGYLAPSEWAQAALVDSLTQREPNTGAPVSESTEFYICYDQDNLYIAARCYDDPDLISAQQLERDASLGNDDKIVVILDTFLDHRNAFWFQMNALGCIGDALLSENGASLNKEWDGLWVGKAAIHKSGWDAELKIPFKSLAFDPGSTTWGLKLEREIQRKVEKSYWPVANVNSYKFQVSDAGLLVGLEGIRQGIGLDLRPYWLARFDQKKYEVDKIDGDLGLDIFYQITPAIKSALTINTDFAQTEVDDKQINLTRFPLFYPEKRDFFLDGASYFQFGREGDQDNAYAQRLIVFFSRRLGLDNSRNPIPILGGIKITGQQGDWNLGMMDVVDERENGNRNFTVARLSRNFGSQSRIGLIGTAGDASAAGRNAVFGMDFKLATSTFSGNKNLSLLVYGLKSETGGLTDKDYAFGGELNFPNDLINFRVGYNQIDKNFNAGIGFIPRKDIKNTYVQGGLNPRPHKWSILQLYFTGALDYITDLSNRLLTREITLKPLGIRFDSGDEFSVKLTQFPLSGSRPDLTGSGNTAPNSPPHKEELSGRYSPTPGEIFITVSVARSVCKVDIRSLCPCSSVWIWSIPMVYSVKQILPGRSFVLRRISCSARKSSSIILSSMTIIQNKWAGNHVFAGLSARVMS